MESAGLPVDAAALAELIQRLQSAIACIRSEIETFTGCDIRSHSSKDIVVVAQSLGVELGRTASGRIRTDRSTLSREPALRSIVRLKELRNRLSTAVGVRNRVRHGRLWPRYVFNKDLGRPHVAEVNYMAWPEELRPTLLPELVHLMVVADFEGMELRVLAALSGDAALAADLNRGDLHRTTAGHLFGKPHESVTDEQRQTAKTLNFAMLYGSIASGLAYKLRIDPHQAQRFIDQWRATYPKAMQFVRRTQRDAVRLGYVETYHGRRRDITALIRQDVGKARRLAINHVIQSTAGDLMRIGLINLWPKVQDLGGRVLGTVHDSYLISVPETVKIPDILRVIREGAIELNEPLFNLRMKVAIGPRWGQYTEEHRL